MTQRIYTRTGDTGETGLFGGGRVRKAHPRVAAYGAMDELNAALGVACAWLEDGEIVIELRRVQADLFVLGAHLATPPTPAGRRRPALPALPVDRVGVMERAMDQASEELPPLTSFILPGGARGGALLHLARTICRRAERQVVALADAETVDPFMPRYLNRLSDLLFVLARLANARAGAPESVWQPAAS